MPNAATTTTERWPHQIRAFDPTSVDDIITHPGAPAPAEPRQL